MDKHEREYLQALQAQLRREHENDYAHLRMPVHIGKVIDSMPELAPARK